MHRKWRTARNEQRQMTNNSVRRTAAIVLIAGRASFIPGGNNNHTNDTGERLVVLFPFPRQKIILRIYLTNP